MAVFLRNQGGIDTSDATAVRSEIVQGKTAYVDDQKLTGTLPVRTTGNHTAASQAAATTLKLQIPETAVYDAQSFLTVTDSNWIESNIVYGKTIFGKTGTMVVSRSYTYNTAGTHIFTMPEGCTQVSVTCVGGGGGGKGGQGGTGFSLAQNPCDSTFYVSGTTAGAEGTNGGNGGPSSFGVYVSSNGGSGGVYTVSSWPAGTYGKGGTGGIGASFNGTYYASGYNGANGTESTTASGIYSIAAGTQVTVTVGAAGSGGGGGSAGASVSNYPFAPVTAPASGTAGTAGAVGKVTVVAF